MSGTGQGLLERAAELGALEVALACAADGEGSNVMVSGPAGFGKSSLVRAAEATARARGFTVLPSCPTPVSPALAHGVVRDWSRRLDDRPSGARSPFRGAAAALLELEHPAGTTSTLDTLDLALLSLLDNLTATGPVLLVVDDVQWADTGSLQILDLLSVRVRQAPVMLLTARSTGELSAGSDILDRVSSRCKSIRPQPLSVLAVEHLRREGPRHPSVSGMSAEELHRLTGGVPFLVREVLQGGRPGGSAPRSVVSSFRGRLDRLEEPARELARTIAVLGKEASFDALAELSQLTVAALADPLEVLADAAIVTLGLWRAWPAHPIVADAILAGMAPSERSARHADAAAYLAELGRPQQVVASHLVHTLPGDDRSVLELLWAAGRESLESGATGTAAVQLLRAAGELPAAQTDPGLLREAAKAQLRNALPDLALDLWTRALTRARGPQELAGCLADLADAHRILGHRSEAAACYEQALDLLQDAGTDRPPGAQRTLLLRSALAGTSPAEPTPPGDADVLLRNPPEEESALARLELSLAARTACADGGSATVARTLALRALGEGRLLEEDSCEGHAFYTAVEVLCWCDSFAEADMQLTAALVQSRRSGSAPGFAMALSRRGFLSYRRGDLHAAVRDLGDVLAARDTGLWDGCREYALTGLALARIALGQHEQARALEPDLREAATRGSTAGPLTLTAAGALRAGAGDHLAALEDYREASELAGPAATPAMLGWREMSVRSLLALGQQREAHDMAREALTAARRWDSPRTVGLALRANAHLLPPFEAQPLLRRAVRLFGSCRSLDQQARAQLHLGELQVREPSTRAEGMHLLTQVLRYGRSADVPPLVRGASRILVRHGARVGEPSGSALEQLTAGERRVVELAVSGLTNRDIARELFVTVKAVEWHLSHAYRKLSISSRTQLAGVLDGDPGASAGGSPAAG